MNAPIPTLTHYVPLRPNFDAMIMLPKDLTEAEADRIAAWLHAMALAEPWPAPPPITTAAEAR